MHHDHDEELGKYWYTDGGTPLPPMPGLPPVQPRRVTVRENPPRDKNYWEQTFNLTLEYLRLQARAHRVEMADAAFIRWLMQTPGEMPRFVFGDDVARAGQVDWFLKVVSTKR